MISDTSKEAEEVQMRILRAMTPQQRLALATGWSRSLVELIRANLRRQFPHASDEEIQRRLVDRTLGEELAAKVYGPLASHIDESGCR